MPAKGRGRIVESKIVLLRGNEESPALKETDIIEDNDRNGMGKNGDAQEYNLSCQSLAENKRHRLYCSASI